jgi:hypothetical protein
MILLRIDSFFSLEPEKVFVLAELLTPIDFSITDQSKLGCAPLEKFLDIPRKIDNKGQPILNIFSFCLKNKAHRDYFIENQIVEFIQ